MSEDTDEHRDDTARPVPDRIAEADAPVGATGGEAATNVSAGRGAPRAVKPHLVTDGDRTDIPPNTVRPEAAPGWDRAVDLAKAPAVVPDAAETEVPADLREEIERHMAKYPDRRSAVLPALFAAQEMYGWCSPEALQQVAAVMQVTPAYLSSIATFYDMLKDEPVGRNTVYVCTSVACHMSDAKAVFDALALAADELALEDTHVREFECLGACDMAPMASVNGRYIGPLSTDDAHDVIEAIKEGREVLPGRGLEDAEYRLPWGGRA